MILPETKSMPWLRDARQEGLLTGEKMQNYGMINLLFISVIGMWLKQQQNKVPKNHRLNQSSSNS